MDSHSGGIDSGTVDGETLGDLGIAAARTAGRQWFTCEITIDGELRNPREIPPQGRATTGVWVGGTA